MDIPVDILVDNLADNLADIPVGNLGILVGNPVGILERSLLEGILGDNLPEKLLGESLHIGDIRDIQEC